MKGIFANISDPDSAAEAAVELFRPSAASLSPTRLTGLPSMRIARGRADTHTANGKRIFLQSLISDKLASTFETQRLDEQSKRSCVLASTGIIQVITRKRLAPVIKNPDKPTVRDILGNLAFKRVGKRQPIQSS